MGKDDLYITKNKASKYEKLLKKQLKAWIVGFNKKSQLIDQDLFDIKEQLMDEDKDEKLDHSKDEENDLIKKQNNLSSGTKKKKLSKKEQRKLEQKKKEIERAKQR